MVMADRGKCAQCGKVAELFSQMTVAGWLVWVDRRRDEYALTKMCSDCYDEAEKAVRALAAILSNRVQG